MSVCGAAWLDCCGAQRGAFCPLAAGLGARRTLPPSVTAVRVLQGRAGQVQRSSVWGTALSSLGRRAQNQLCTKNGSIHELCNTATDEAINRGAIWPDRAPDGRCRG